MKKLKLNVDSVVPASTAAKNFAKVCKHAKSNPQFISQNNTIDSVIQSYEDYERMYMELETLRELFFDIKVSERIKKADLNPELRLSIKEVKGEKDYAEFKKIDPNSISDEALFE